MNLRFIIMNTGYVESSSTSTLIYQCGFFGNPGYASYKEAITDLALDLYAKFYDDVLSVYHNRYAREIKDCCRKSLIDNNDAKFCSDCGQELHDKPFDPEEFMEYIVHLQNSTADSYGDAEYANKRHLTWWPYWVGDFIGAPKEEVIAIAENAELLLTSALMEAKPELKEDVDDYGSNDDWEQFKNNEQPSYR